MSSEPVILAVHGVTDVTPGATSAKVAAFIDTRLVGEREKTTDGVHLAEVDGVRVRVHDINWSDLSPQPKSAAEALWLLVRELSELPLVGLREVDCAPRTHRLAGLAAFFLHLAGYQVLVLGPMVVSALFVAVLGFYVGAWTGALIGLALGSFAAWRVRRPGRASFGQRVAQLAALVIPLVALSWVSVWHFRGLVGVMVVFLAAFLALMMAVLSILDRRFYRKLHPRGPPVPRRLATGLLAVFALTASVGFTAKTLATENCLAQQWHGVSVGECAPDASVMTELRAIPVLAYERVIQPRWRDNVNRRPSPAWRSRLAIHKLWRGLERTVDLGWMALFSSLALAGFAGLLPGSSGRWWRNASGHTGFLTLLVTTAVGWCTVYLLLATTLAGMPRFPYETEFYTGDSAVLQSYRMRQPGLGQDERGTILLYGACAPSTATAEHCDRLGTPPSSIMARAPLGGTDAVIFLVLCIGLMLGLGGVGLSLWPGFSVDLGLRRPESEAGANARLARSLDRVFHDGPRYLWGVSWLITVLLALYVVTEGWFSGTAWDLGARLVFGLNNQTGWWIVGAGMAFAVAFLASLVFLRTPLDFVQDTLRFADPTDHTLNKSTERLLDVVRQLDADGGRRVLVLAYSQGTLVAVSALQKLGQIPGDGCARVDPCDSASSFTLITCGCPLRSSYHQFVPYGMPWVGEALDGADRSPIEWRNYYFAGDWVGRALWAGSPQYERRSDTLLGFGGHTGYLAPQVHEDSPRLLLRDAIRSIVKDGRTGGLR